jgi:hypothetical protein
MKKTLVVLLLVLSGIVFLGCSYDQEDYYEVHSLVIGETIFRYVDPSEGAELHSQNEWDDQGTYFIYLYEPETGVTFDYTQFFMAIGDEFLYQRISDGTYFIKRTDEIDSLIFDFGVGKEVFENQE